MGTVISGQWWRSHQSLACKDLCILKICVTPWKDESEPNIKYCLGATVGMVQRFITIQNFWHNRRRTNGIRVEYFPTFYCIAARPWSPKVHEQNGQTRTIPRTNYLHVDVQWHHVVIKTMKRNVLLIPHLCLCSQKDFFQQDVGHSSDLGERQSGIPLTKKDQEENGIESLNWW